MADARIKYQSVSSTLTTVKQGADPAAYARFVAALSPELRTAIERSPGASAWVPVRWLDESLRAAYDIVYGRSDLRMRKHGREAISIDMSGPYKLFIKALSPQYVVSRVPIIWDQYYENNGAMTVLRFDEKAREVEIAFSGIVIPSQAFWQNQAGTIEGTMLLTRLKRPVIEIVKGGGAKDSACTMLARYQ